MCVSIVTMYWASSGIRGRSKGGCCCLGIIRKTRREVRYCGPFPLSDSHRIYAAVSYDNADILLLDYSTLLTHCYQHWGEKFPKIVIRVRFDESVWETKTGQTQVGSGTDWYYATKDIMWRHPVKTFKIFRELLTRKSVINDKTTLQLIQIHWSLLRNTNYK